MISLLLNEFLNPEKDTLADKYNILQTLRHKYISRYKTIIWYSCLLISLPFA